MSEEKQPTVYLVEDDDAVRDSLKLVLESVGLSVEDYARADDFLSVWSEDMAGCIVLDIRMPGMNGMELQRKLNTMHCTLPIIFVTGHGDVPMAVEAMQQGAVDFIPKPYREQELLDKIQKAIEIDREQRKVLGERHVIEAQLSALTPRELEVMNLMVEGKANKSIAFDLDISQRTVEIHRARVMDKMDTRSVAQLVRKVMATRSEE
jgi:FixJ family two-component response regulator